MTVKQLIVAVESTAAMGYYWATILGDYLEKIIRCFGGNDSTGQKSSASTVEFALVSYNTHGCYSGCLVQRTGWTRDPDVFFLWLSSIPFNGGGFNDVAIAEGLAEVLMMFPNSQSGDPNQQSVDMHKHCILVAASNPFPLPTPVYVPRPQNLEQSETIHSDTRNCLYDAEAVAEAFPQLSISLSIICPKQLPKIKAIYNAGKQNSRAADPPVLAKTRHFLILISEGFREAQGALEVGEGSLSGQGQGQLVSITKLEGYKNSSASVKLAVNCPPVMQTVQLISQDHMNNNFLGNEHTWISWSAAEKEADSCTLLSEELLVLMTVRVQLFNYQSQTLLLSVSDKACRLIGMLFPGNMVVFKPQLSSQQHQHMQSQ